MPSSPIQFYASPSYATSAQGDTQLVYSAQFMDVATEEAAAEQLYAAMAAVAMYSPQAIADHIHARPSDETRGWTLDHADRQLGVASAAKVQRELANQGFGNKRAAEADWDAIGAVLLKDAMSKQEESSGAPVVHQALHLLTGRPVVTQHLDFRGDSANARFAAADLYEKLSDALEHHKPVVLQVHNTNVIAGISKTGYFAVMLNKLDGAQTGPVYQQLQYVLLRGADGKSDRVNLADLIDKSAVTYSMVTD